MLSGRAYHTSIDLGVLDRAWRLARRGKRARVDVARFEMDVERRLVALCERLARRAWRPSPYRVFTVRDPVVRTIAALPFEDRVVQHALMAFVAPRIERSLAAQTWACLPERGSHRALAWVAEHARRRRWCLRLDVRKFFPSVDHAVLREALARLHPPGEEQLRWLEDLLLDHPGPFERATFWFAGDDLFAGLRPRGLPIGNLTSQWWANLVLSPLDHMLANHLGVREFARYMDDVVVLDDDRARLERIWQAYDAGLARVRLKLHPTKCEIRATRDGFAFLGFRIRRTDVGVAVHLADESVERFRARMAEIMARYEVGAVEPEEVRSRVMAWRGHAMHGHTRALCRKVLDELVFVRRRSGTDGGIGGHGE